MTDMMQLASYEHKHKKYEVNYDPSESPALRYQVFWRTTEKEWIQKINLPIMGGDELEAQGQHPCFNWHHYLLNKATVESFPSPSPSRFVSLVHQLAPEIEHHHRLGAEFLVNEKQGDILRHLMSLANQYPFIEFIVYQPTSPNRPQLRVFMGWNQALINAISTRDFEDFIQLIHDVRPDITCSLSEMKYELLMLQPAELLAAAVNPYRAKDPLRIASGDQMTPWKTPLPQALLQESETRRCLLARIKGYPLALLFGTD